MPRLNPFSKYDLDLGYFATGPVCSLEGSLQCGFASVLD